MCVRGEKKPRTLASLSPQPLGWAGPDPSQRLAPDTGACTPSCHPAWPEDWQEAFSASRCALPTPASTNLLEHRVLAGPGSPGMGVRPEWGGEGCLWWGPDAGTGINDSRVWVLMLNFLTREFRGQSLDLPEPPFPHL